MNMTSNSFFQWRTLLLILLLNGSCGFQSNTVRPITTRSSSSSLSLLTSGPVQTTTARKITPAAIVVQHMVPVDKGFNLLEIASGIVPQGTIVQTAKEGWKFAWKRMMTELAPQDKQGNYQRPNYRFSSSTTTTTTASSTSIASSSTSGSGLVLNTKESLHRYHLYTGNPCPWCHRAVLAIKLLGITPDQVGWTILEDNPVKASRGGWVFSEPQPDPLGNRDLRGLYDMLQPGFQGRCTAPLLIDKKAKVIVSNESSDIVRMLCRATFANDDDNNNKKNRMQLLPPELEKSIDETNKWTYELLNNGVYRCGFATTQSAYDRASADVRTGLTRANELLAKQPFLCGNQFTEADLRLLPTILRFDGAYAPLFRAGGAHLHISSHYPHLHQWLKRCWAIPGVSDSIDIADACASYYKQLFPLNPGGIVPSPVTAESLGLE